MISPPVGLTASQLWDAIKQGNQTHVKVEFPVQGVTFTDEDINLSQGVSIEDIFNAETNLAPGCAVMKQVNIGVLGSSKTVDLDWTEEFTLSFGVEVSGVTYWTAVGKYQGERPDDVMVADAFTFVAYDRMKWFDISADNLLASIGYPQTVGNLYNKVCTSVGITGTIQTGLNPTMLTRQFTSAPFEGNGYTCRDLLSWIAEACGVYARINADGECVLTWFTDNTSHTVEPNQEFHVEHAELFNGYIWQDFDQLYWYEADKLTWAMACGYQEAYNIDYIQVSQYNSDADAIYPGVIGTNAYMVVGNPFLAIEQYEDIENYVIPIYNRIHSFGGHLPARIECIGNWLVEAGDIITAYVSDVDTIQMPIFCRTLRWNGAITAEYETTGTIRWNAVSASNKEKIWTRNSIRFIATDECYKRQSGIEIQPEGIDISGNKYLRLKSGSTFDVESDNFSINSNTKEMTTGKWKFSDDGISYSDEEDNFVISELENIADIQSNGIFHKNRIYGTGSSGYLYLGTYYKYNNIEHKFIMSMVSTYNDVYDYDYAYLTLVLDSPATRKRINISGGNDSVIGTINTDVIAANTGSAGAGNIKLYPGNQTTYGSITFDTFTENSVNYVRTSANQSRYIGKFYAVQGLSGMLDIYPRDLTNSYIVCQQYTYNGNQYTKIYGSIGANMIFEGQHTAPSSRDIKHDIKNLESQGEVIDSLEPVSFTYDDDPSEAKHFGLIYEDTINVLPEVCTGDETSKAINYVELVPLLLKEIQDLRKRVSVLEEKLNERG